MPETRKKMTILAILEILKRHSDADHTLLQADIIDWLRRDYDLAVTRKTVSQNLADLVDAGYPLEYANGWYYEHEFCVAELDLLVQGVQFNNYIAPGQRRELIEKLKTLGSEHYAPRTFSIAGHRSSSQFMYTMEIVQGAVDRGKKINFQYMDLDVDKRQHPRLTVYGEPKIYLVNPYRIAMANGRYYLICNVEKYDSVAHFRLDRIAECRELDAPVKPMAEVHGLENGLNIQEYLERHVFMYSGKVRQVRIRAKRSLAGEILDWFGMDVMFENVTDESLEALFEADEVSLKYWLLRYGEHAERIE